MLLGVFQVGDKVCSIQPVLQLDIACNYFLLMCRLLLDDSYLCSLSIGIPEHLWKCILPGHLITVLCAPSYATAVDFAVRPQRKPHAQPSTCNSNFACPSLTCVCLLAAENLHPRGEPAFQSSYVCWLACMHITLNACQPEWPPQAFEILKASEEGLTGEEVKRRLDQYGYNKLPESTRNPFLVPLLPPFSWILCTLPCPRSCSRSGAPLSICPGA